MDHRDIPPAADGYSRMNDVPPSSYNRGAEPYGRPNRSFSPPAKRQGAPNDYPRGGRGGRSPSPPPQAPRGGNDRYYEERDRDDKHNTPTNSYNGSRGHGSHRERSPDDRRRSGQHDDDRRRPRAPRRPVIRGSEEERCSTTMLFVGNIPYHYTAQDLTRMAEKFGPVLDVTVPMDRITGKNKGFCFLDFRDRRDAEDFFDEMSRHGTVEGRRVKVDWDIGKNKKGIVDPPEGRREPRESRPRGDRDRNYDREPRDFDRGAPPPSQLEAPPRGGDRDYRYEDNARYVRPEPRDAPPASRGRYD